MFILTEVVHKCVYKEMAFFSAGKMYHMPIWYGVCSVSICGVNDFAKESLPGASVTLKVI